MIVVGPLINVLVIALQIYVWIVIASAILSWLLAFDIVNRRNRVVYMIADFLYRVTEPALAPIRRFLPNLGGIDISPVILILIIIFLQSVLTNLRMELMHGGGF